jgi:hypothetical protein
MVENNMAERKGRVTIGDDGRVIGSGGDLNAKEFNVEDRNGKVIGTTSSQEAQNAYLEGRSLKYNKKGWFF